MIMKNKTYAVVTAATVREYRNSGFIPGAHFQVENRDEATGIITITTPLGLAGGYEERFFDVREVSYEDLVSNRLKKALVELKECFCLKNLSGRKTLEALVTDDDGNFDENIEGVAQTLADFLQNDCDDELHALSEESIRPFKEDGKY